MKPLHVIDNILQIVDTLPGLPASFCRLSPRKAYP